MNRKTRTTLREEESEAVKFTRILMNTGGQNVRPSNVNWGNYTQVGLIQCSCGVLCTPGHLCHDPMVDGGDSASI